MSIRVKCSGCGKTIKAGDDWAGKRGKCPACGAEFNVPDKSTELPVRPLALAATNTLVTQVIARPIAIRVPCPFCGEEIAETAIKCRHCNEFLDGRVNQPPAPQQVYVAPAAAPQVNVQVVQRVRVAGAYKRWSRGTAMLLSLIIPGAGQMYKGQPINGMAWFFVTIVGYLFFIIPGLVLHFFCILGAGMGDPYR